MNIYKASLADMLDAREVRVMKQNEFIRRYNCPLICFTMNIAGEIKCDPLIKVCFQEGLRRIVNSKINIIFSETQTNKTGCTAYIAVRGDAQSIKSQMEAIEECDALARLFDIDVIDANGEKLSRESQRGCVVCGAPVKACARSRAHGLETVRKAMYERMVNFAADLFAQIAYDALIYEVNVTPKPGLVDRRNNGAHNDMDIRLFYKSADAIKPFFARMVKASVDYNNCGDLCVTMEELRFLGIKAEKAMMKATNGVNTHRGLIYTLGLMLGGIGLSLTSGNDFLDTASALARVGMEAEFERIKTLPQSNGDIVYAKYGIKGVRAEAAQRFPNVVQAAADYGEYSIVLSENDAGALILCDIMARLEDTNVLHRGGVEGAKFVRESAEKIAKMQINERSFALYAMDDTLIKKNLSPGGAADILAAAKLLYESEKLFNQ